jgi:2-dehydro-3-deoxyphosphogluconate aldolase / (4S)-4-hydroxy-2-oxoglutarate aldolase
MVAGWGLGRSVELNIPIIGILRGIKADFFGPLMAAAFDAGLQAIEVTFNTAHALDMVKEQIARVPQGKYLGMGTIRNLDEATQAVDAGAMFLVSPNTDLAVIEFAKKRQIPIVAGAFTPTEVYAAWSAGADMIKVFPCGAMGPGYIRELLGPYDAIPLVAVGGVNADNVASYLRAGARAVGVGASLFGKDAISRQQTEEIADNVNKFISRSIS